jgi:hypothetical protein
MYDNPKSADYLLSPKSQFFMKKIEIFLCVSDHSFFAISETFLFKSCTKFCMTPIFSLAVCL